MQLYKTVQLFERVLFINEYILQTLVLQLLGSSFVSSSHKCARGNMKGGADQLKGKHFRGSNTNTG